jgi:hypothetical protein
MTTRMRVCARMTMRRVAGERMMNARLKKTGDVAAFDSQTNNKWSE